MSKLLLPLILGFSLALSSCMSLQELTLDQCQSTKWYQKGSTDAMAGKKYSESETTRCAQVGVKTATEQYLSGFTDGIKRFCTSEYGQKFALEGNTYKGNNSLLPAFPIRVRQGIRVLDSEKLSGIVRNVCFKRHSVQS